MNAAESMCSLRFAEKSRSVMLNLVSKPNSSSSSSSSTSSKSKWLKIFKNTKQQQITKEIIVDEGNIYSSTSRGSDRVTSTSSRIESNEMKISSPAKNY